MALHLRKKVIPSQSSSQTTSNNAVLQGPASRDLPAIPFDSSEDEDESNGQLQKRNLFQSLQHSRAQSHSNSKLDTKKKFYLFEQLQAFRLIIQIIPNLPNRNLSWTKLFRLIQNVMSL